MEIRNLDGLTRLEKLQLDNNIIMKIEGLDHLVNLKWLDLSFNNISKIEGLDHLVNLTDLSLFQNQITTLEGMDSLTKLNYLSIGNNKIASADAVTYLQKFKSLQVLIIQGNPFCKNDTDNEARYLVIASLPQLKYLDYMMIDDESIKAARASNTQAYKTAEEALHSKPEMTNESKKRELDEANIGGTYTLGEDLKDPDMKKLEYIQRQPELWGKFEEELKEILSNYQDAMKLMAQGRKETMEVCEKLLRDEAKEAEDKGIKCIDAFKRSKKHIFKDNQTQKFEIESMEGLKKELKQLDNDLMRIEMDHFDLAWNQVLNKFNATLETITNNMIKQTHECKDNISTANKKYHNLLRDLCQTTYDAIYSRVNEEPEPLRDDLMNTYGEKETLLTVAETSNTTQTNIIDATCSNIQTLLARVKSDFLKNLLEGIISRNRKVVKEIIELIKVEEGDIDRFIKENTSVDDDDNQQLHLIIQQPLSKRSACFIVHYSDIIIKQKAIYRINIIKSEYNEQICFIYLNRSPILPSMDPWTSNNSVIAEKCLLEVNMGLVAAVVSGG
eukprot:TRINITY_DN322_c5_g1_i1.p1 TRINITY_DN322_c5_g1~~TRINITY_DN322_c5_g1_i1.p1  ORF type:complete len:558 (+),score=94.37 TRINITY_DN322_c5_g1_i1:4775-6448(+)